MIMSEQIVVMRNRLYNTINNTYLWSTTKICNETPVELIEVRLEKIDPIWNEFHNLEDELFQHFPEVESTAIVFENLFFETKANLLKAIRERQTIHNPIVSVNSDPTPLINQLFDQQRSFLGTLHDQTLVGDRTIDRTSLTENINLPKVSIEPFDGEYRNWPPFEDSYLTSIHNNNSLSNVVKLKLLKRLITEGPASLIRNLSETDANYDEAWNKLKSRYDKKKRILTSYITTFLDLPSATSGRASDIRLLSDKSDELLIGIRTMGTSAEYRDGWLIQILLRKLDSETRQSWSKESVNKEFPTIFEFFTFLNVRCDGLDDGMDEPIASKGKSNSAVQGFNPKPPIRVMAVSEDTTICLCCNRNHPIYRCFKFRGMKTKVRQDFANQIGVCQNCLRQGHTTAECDHPYSCKVCNHKHHTLLHPYSAQPQHNNQHNNLINNQHNYQQSSTINSSAVPITSQDHSTSNEQLVSDPQNIKINTIIANINSNSASKPTAASATSPRIAILPTALVSIRDKTGSSQFAYALLDSGSQSTFITERLVQRLGLDRTHSSIIVSGLASKNPTTTKGLVEIEVSSRKSNDSFLSQALILPKLLTLHPTDVTEVHQSDQLSRLDLADPDFGRRKDIDILFGSDVFFDLIKPEKIVISGHTQAQSTRFGWVIITPQLTGGKTTNMSTIVTGEEINRSLQRFWELEQPPSAPQFSPEDQQCEEYFIKSVYRNDEGRYTVQIPFRTPRLPLGHSRTSAVRRLLNMERRFAKCESLASDYRKFMNEYLSLGHMEIIPDPEIEKSDIDHFYLPHHGVFKLDSTTTKLRVVFDGSCKTTSGYSLNDTVLVGPTIQNDLVSLITRFRQHQIVFSADVEKMYRQVLIAPDHSDFHRIVWRNSPADPITHYRLKTVTYGTSCAPFLAIRTLHRIAEDNNVQYPKIAEMIKKDFYVDDLLSGCETVEEALNIVNGITTVLGGAGLPLRKWKSNSLQFLKGIRDDLKEPSILNFDDETMTVKTLGLQWNPNRDSFSFKINVQHSNTTYSKRNLLSEISKVFDPLGWVSPSTIVLKLLFQKLWSLKIEWDDELPPAVKLEWTKLKQNLPHLENIQIPRYMGLSKNISEVEIHGFCDASELAYAAVVYLRVISFDGHISTCLVVAKTRVAPIRQISLPRLELCGAGLLVNLMKFVSTNLDYPQVSMYGWTDSKIVLAWLSDLPRRWKTFVANRVAEIIDVLPRSYWNHVISKENPADCASRGLDPRLLQDFNLWWCGPTWLSLEKSQWPQCNEITLETKIEERQVMVLTHQAPVQHDVIANLLNKFSSYESVRRTMAYILKFRDRNLPFVVLLRRADQCIIRNTQLKVFGDEIRELKKGRDLHRRSPISALTPFIDGDDLLRVGGRLNYLDAPFGVKHPIILPRRHKLVDLIIQEAHITYLHAGPTLLTSILRQKYWILDIRNSVRHFVHKCITCYRLKQETAKQLMGALPKARVTAAKPFTVTGVDYAGPIYLKARHGRGRTATTKGYISIFVCFATKAIHLELVSDMTAEAYIAALRRFVSRRGIPVEIVSDNGTNFVGAKKLLQSLFEFFQVENKKLTTLFLSQTMIKFTFNPASAPHFGGLWESNIRSVKYHLKRVAENAILTFEEMSTLLSQIEALLNSRPLCPMSANPDDFTYLTPGHFLIGEPPTCIPEPDLQHVPMTRLSRWQNIQMRVQGFWKSWSKNYLHTLQTRPKWKTRQTNLQIGDVVLIKEDGVPPTKWLLARITDLHPGADGLVRVARVKTSTGELLRPIVKLCRLPIDREDSENNLLHS